MDDRFTSAAETVADKERANQEDIDQKATAKSGGDEKKDGAV